MKICSAALLVLLLVVSCGRNSHPDQPAVQIPHPDTSTWAMADTSAVPDADTIFRNDSSGFDPNADLSP